MLDILQWAAAIFILVGYVCYAKKNVWGPIFSSIGCVGFTIWSFSLAAYGIFALNSILFLVNLWAWYNWKD